MAPLSDAGLTGQVATGSTGISGTHVYLFAANTTGYGQASLPLLSATETGTSDTVGPYVLSNSLGNFSMSGAYSCTSGQQLYLYALGGTAGSQSVPQAGLLAAIGSCPATSSTVVAQVNEVSTVAAAWSLAGFATDAVHVSSSGTALAQVGVANAFANAANLVTLSTGVARTANVSGNGTVPQAEINGLANILSVCVNPGNTTFPFVASNCSLLLGDALSVGTTGNTPTDTATAAINIAHNPGANNISDIYDLPDASPYTPTLSRQPNDFTIAVTYTGGGLNGPQGIAIDGSGNAWIANLSGSSVTKISSAGRGAVRRRRVCERRDQRTGSDCHRRRGNAWVANQTTSTVTEVSSTGTVLRRDRPIGREHACAGRDRGGRRGKCVGGELWRKQRDRVFERGCADGRIALLGRRAGPAVCDRDGRVGQRVGDEPGGQQREQAVERGCGGSGANGLCERQCGGSRGIAMDGTGNAWVANRIRYGGGGFDRGSARRPAYRRGRDGAGASRSMGRAMCGLPTKRQHRDRTLEWGTAAVGADGYTNGALNGPRGIAIDGSGDAWVTNFGGNAVMELIGAATPVVTPIAAGLPSTPSVNGSSKLGRSRRVTS